MELQAALDPIVAILVGVGWFIFKAFLDRRADTDEWEQSPPPLPRAQTPPPPVRTGPPTTPPPVIRTATTTRPALVEPEGPLRADLAHLKQSQESYNRAAQLQQTIAARLHAIDQQTAAAKPLAPATRPRTEAASRILRTFRNPATVRHAFLAQFVLNPPKSLE